MARLRLRTLRFFAAAAAAAAVSSARGASGGPLKASVDGVEACGLTEAREDFVALGSAGSAGSSLLQGAWEASRVAHRDGSAAWDDATSLLSGAASSGIQAEGGFTSELWQLANAAAGGAASDVGASVASGTAQRVAPIAPDLGQLAEFMSDTASSFASAASLGARRSPQASAKKQWAPQASPTPLEYLSPPAPRVDVAPPLVPPLLDLLGSFTPSGSLSSVALLESLVAEGSPPEVFAMAREVEHAHVATAILAQQGVAERAQAGVARRALEERAQAASVKAAEAQKRAETAEASAKAATAQVAEVKAALEEVERAAVSAAEGDEVDAAGAHIAHLLDAEGAGAAAARAPDMSWIPDAEAAEATLARLEEELARPLSGEPTSEGLNSVTIANEGLAANSTVPA